ncbi:MAG: hypothetical protein O2782_14345 [bacterium]|nr:hypothetical protein [bacterium]
MKTRNREWVQWKRRTTNSGFAPAQGGYEAASGRLIDRYKDNVVAAVVAITGDFDAAQVSFPGSFGITETGGGLGSGAGELLFPVSFDATLDGRVYVLDAGNARVQVFAADGEYITHWGEPGGDPGQFDFRPSGGGRGQRAHPEVCLPDSPSI